MYLIPFAVFIFKININGRGHDRNSIFVVFNFTRDSTFYFLRAVCIVISLNKSLTTYVRILLKVEFTRSFAPNGVFKIERLFGRDFRKFTLSVLCIKIKGKVVYPNRTKHKTRICGRIAFRRVDLQSIGSEIPLFAKFVSHGLATYRSNVTFFVEFFTICIFLNAVYYVPTIKEIARTRNLECVVSALFIVGSYQFYIHKTLRLIKLEYVHHRYAVRSREHTAVS